MAIVESVGRFRILLLKIRGHAGSEAGVIAVVAADDLDLVQLDLRRQSRGY